MGEFREKYLNGGWKYLAVPQRIGQFLPSLDPQETPWWKTLWHADRLLKAGETVALIGPFGRGKSVMSALLLGLYWEREMGGARGGDLPKYSIASDLVERVKEAIGHDGESVVIREICRTPMLVIDELHERHATDYSTALLTRIVKKRYDRLRPTLLISNEEPKQIANHVGASMLDRMVATNALIVCDWDNLRRGGSGRAV